MKEKDLNPYIGKEVLVYAENHRIASGFLHIQNHEACIAKDGTVCRFPVSSILYLISVNQRQNGRLVRV